VSWYKITRGSPFPMETALHYVFLIRYPYFIVGRPEFRISKIENSPSANFALQPTNSLKKPNHHLTNQTVIHIDLHSI